MIPRRRALLLVGLLLAGSVACGSRRGLRQGPGDEVTGVAALYRARFDPGENEKSRRFRLLVYAADPARLHGEILSAVGTTELILDGGSERVSVHFVRERVAYVGPADEGSLAGLLGVPLDVATLVEALRGRAPVSESLVWRVVAGENGYPAEVEVADGVRKLVLSLKRLRPIRADLSDLGTGRPPPDVEIRPLAELDPDTLPGVEVEGEEAP